MRILLLCAAGMSTSLLVTKMESYAKSAGYTDFTIKAEPVEDLENFVEDYDVFLLGPQIKYKESWVKEVIASSGKPCTTISPIDYGRIDGKKVFELAKTLLQVKE